MTYLPSKTGMIFDFKRYTLHDGPGIRAAVHFKGCPLSCWWCHNPESQSAIPQTLFRKERCISCGACDGGPFEDADSCPSGAKELCGKKITVSDLMTQVLKERIFFEQSGGGVTLSGGEPLLQPDFAIAVLKECRKHEIHTAVDTCGFADRSVLMEILPLTDLFLYDVKHMDSEKHLEYTGVGNELILSNMEALGKSGALICARMPFIPGINTDEKNLHSASAFLRKIGGVVKVNLLPYHNAAEEKHRRWNIDYKLKGLCAPSEELLKNSAATLESYGLKVEIGG